MASGFFSPCGKLESMLDDYATFLRGHHLDALADDNVRRLLELDAPLLARFPEVSLEARRERVRTSLAALLTAMAEGRATAHVAERLSERGTGALPGAPLAAMEAHDTVLVYAAQEQAMLAMVGRYTQDAETALALAQALRSHYIKVQAMAFEAFVRLSQDTAARTARLEAEQEAARLHRRDLEHSNRQLADEVARKRAILAAAIDAVITIDQDNRVLEFNPAAEQMFGYTAEEMLGRDMVPMIVPERFREAHNRGIRHFMATGEGPALSKRVELPAMRRDGTEFPAEFVIIHLGIEGQTAFTSFIRDLTEQKRAAEANQQLEAMKQADVLKDQFLSILSHELRTPINAVTGFGSVLQDDATELTPTHRRYLDTIMASADHLLALVDDLLDMSRIQAGKFSLQPGVLHFSRQAAETLGMLAPMAEQKHLVLLNEVPADLPAIAADAQRVGQVLTNYVTNAIKFTGAGGTVRVRAGVRDGMLFCEVEDTGEGIAEADLPRLFQRFGQLDGSNTRQAKGTGLGLSISKALIEAHGGAVGVASVWGRGSTFWFTVPLNPVAETTAGPPA